MVHFITPESSHTPEEIRMQSVGLDELRVVLEPDLRALSDLRLLIKTETFVRRKQGTSLTTSQEQILRSKASRNAERERELVERLRKSVADAELIVNGSDINSNAHEAQARISDGLQELVSRTYTQLKLLGGSTIPEQQIEVPQRKWTSS